MALEAVRHRATPGTSFRPHRKARKTRLALLLETQPPATSALLLSSAALPSLTLRVRQRYRLLRTPTLPTSQKELITLAMRVMVVTCSLPQARKLSQARQVTPRTPKHQRVSSGILSSP